MRAKAFGPCLRPLHIWFSNCTHAERWRNTQTSMSNDSYGLDARRTQGAAQKARKPRGCKRLALRLQHVACQLFSRG